LLYFETAEAASPGLGIQDDYREQEGTGEEYGDDTAADEEDGEDHDDHEHDHEEHDHDEHGHDHEGHDHGHDHDD